MNNYKELYFKDIFNYKVYKMGFIKRENDKFIELLVSLLIANKILILNYIF